MNSKTTIYRNLHGFTPIALPLDEEMHGIVRDEFKRIDGRDLKYSNPSTNMFGLATKLSDGFEPKFPEFSTQIQDIKTLPSFKPSPQIDADVANDLYAYYRTLGLTLAFKNASTEQSHPFLIHGGMGVGRAQLVERTVLCIDNAHLKFVPNLFLNWGQKYDGKTDWQILTNKNAFGVLFVDSLIRLPTPKILAIN